MEDDKLNEYNSIGAPSEDVKRKLLYLAEIGSEAITSAFRICAGYAGHNSQERQDAADAEFHALAEMAMASQERIAQFRQRIDLFDHANLAALRESDEKLQAAQQKRHDIRERAYEVTKADGTAVKVYRDNEIVRDDGGSIVSPEIVDTDEIPASYPTWAQRLDAERDVRQAQQAYDEVVEYRELLNSARERLEDGKLSAEEVDELDIALVKDMPDAVRRHYEDPALPAQSQATGHAQAETATPTFETDLRPTGAFNPAALGAMPGTPTVQPDDALKPPDPAASSPAPM